ncbi:MAG TPA: restriction endonuclease subunit S [Candidatus Cloacimonadota bacterium]|nr:restriction endonuclease subunit S [Candidatus Cloacimonadota bacterium]HPT70916.1 restriction endonuclease subunit S [Candidatus Cloacimonadota bacterium]
MKQVKLGNKEYFTIIIGQSPPSDSYNKHGDGLPFFQGKADFGLLNPIPTVWCNAPSRIAETGDILLSVRAPVGPLNIASETSCIGRGLAAIRTTDKAYSKYVYWVLRNFETTIAKDGSGSMFNSITKEQVYNIRIPLPDTYEEQVAIANKLDAKLAQVDQISQAILKQNEATQNLHMSMLLEVFPQEYCDQVEDGLKFTKTSSLKSLCLEIAGGGTPDTTNLEYWTGTVPWISSADILDIHTITPRRFITQKAIEDSATHLVPKGSIIFVTRVGVGKICIAPFDLCFSQDSHGLILDPKKVNVEYLLLYLLSIMPSIKDSMQGSTVKGITRDMLESLIIPLPETYQDQISLANQLYLKLAQIEQMLKANELQLSASNALPSTILKEEFNFLKEQ